MRVIRLLQNLGERLLKATRAYSVASDPPHDAADARVHQILEQDVLRGARSDRAGLEHAKAALRRGEHVRNAPNVRGGTVTNPEELATAGKKSRGHVGTSAGRDVRCRTRDAKFTAPRSLLLLHRTCMKNTRMPFDRSHQVLAAAAGSAGVATSASTVACREATCAARPSRVAFIGSAEAIIVRVVVSDDHGAI